MSGEIQQMTASGVVDRLRTHGALIGATLVTGLAANAILPMTATGKETCTTSEQTMPDGSIQSSENCTFETGTTTTTQQGGNVLSPQSDFPGYNMGASPFTSGNGCFVTATASVIRRATGESFVDPRYVYDHSSALRSDWSPSAGVKHGYLFNILPDIAKRYDLGVKKAGFKGVWNAVENGDQAMILFGRGYFTSIGHYVAVRGALPNGRIVLDDPNGRGKHGDSERASGWSGSELSRLGALAYRVVYNKH